MSARGPGLEKRMAGETIAGRRGEVSMQMTASDIFSLAINVTQNDWPLDGCDSIAMREVLGEIYERLLEGSRKAVARRLAKRVP